MAFELFIVKRAEKEINKLPDKLAKKVVKRIEKLRDNPYASNSKKLSGDGGHRLRVGAFRVLYRVDKKSKRIFILRVADRKDVY